MLLLEVVLFTGLSEKRILQSIVLYSTNCFILGMAMVHRLLDRQLRNRLNIS